MGIVWASFSWLDLELSFIRRPALKLISGEFNLITTRNYSICVKAWLMEQEESVGRTNDYVNSRCEFIVSTAIIIWHCILISNLILSPSLSRQNCLPIWFPHNIPPYASGCCFAAPHFQFFLCVVGFNCGPLATGALLLCDWSIWCSEKELVSVPWSLIVAGL